MRAICKIISIGEIEEKTSKRDANKTFKQRNVWLENREKYGGRFVAQCVGDYALEALAGFKEGDMCRVSLQITTFSRSGRNFTFVNAHDFRKTTRGARKDANGEVYEEEYDEEYEETQE